MLIPAHKKLLKGFTLIELLIVIAILGILAAAVLIAVNPAKRQNQAKDANIKSDIASIATALQAYYTAPGNGSYPANLGVLVTDQDLKSQPVPPGAAAATTYSYTPSPAGCDPNAATPVVCKEAVVYWPLFDPATAGNVWCWRSATGKASEMAPASCTP